MFGMLESDTPRRVGVGGKSDRRWPAFGRGRAQLACRCSRKEVVACGAELIRVMLGPVSVAGKTLIPALNFPPVRGMAGDAPCIPVRRFLVKSSDGWMATRTIRQRGELLVFQMAPLALHGGHRSA